MELVPANSEAVRRAADILRRGGLVAFPTETVYGLGADATNPAAVARVFEVKARPRFDPLIVHLAAVDWLDRFAENVPSDGRRLAEKFWPGPLTLVLRKRPVIPDLVTAGLPTVGLRAPSHPVARQMMVEAGLPVAAPSANRFGRLSPTTAQAVAEELAEGVELILDGGPTPHGIESTILGFDGSLPRLLRPGPITIEQIREAIGREPCRELPTGAPTAPGQLPCHYAPATPLRLVNHAAELRPACGMRVGLLAFREPPPGVEFSAVEVLSPRGDLREAAARLFGALRRLDAARLDLIVVETVPETGLGLAIMDRLRRAAARPA